MSDVQVMLGTPNGDGHNLRVIYRWGEEEYLDTFDAADGFKREQSIKRMATRFGLGPKSLKGLDAQLVKLIKQHLAENKESPIGKVVYRTLDTVAAAKLSWLWPGRIPLGKYTEIIGYPGVGKSVLMLDIIARVSRGGACPDSQEPMGPGDVVLLGAEDDAADTERPRLDAAGADVSRVYLLDAIGWYDSDAKRETLRAVSLDRDAPAIEEVLKNCRDPRLVVIDPITAYCGNVDSHKAAEVRALLVPITNLAAKYNVAIVGITHFNKGNNGPAVARGMGSLAWVAAARMAWGVIRDTADPTNRLLLPIKCNLAADVSGLSYKIVDMGGVPVVAWSSAAVSTTIDEVLAASSGKERATPKRANAKTWLAGLLANGRIPAAEVWRAADQARIGERLVDWAKSQLGIVPYAEGFGRDCTWYWELRKGDEF